MRASQSDEFSRSLSVADMPSVTDWPHSRLLNDLSSDESANANGDGNQAAGSSLEEGEESENSANALANKPNYPESIFTQE